MSQKRVMAGLLAAMMIVAGIVVLPNIAKAETNKTGEDIIYDNSYTMSKYWTPGKQTQEVPVKEGYVFGGWYEKKGIIRFAANAETVGTPDMLNDIFASVRFDVKEGATKASSYTFDVTAGEFVDWVENDVKNVWAWDYKY